jgi:hypothetical protein
MIVKVAGWAKHPGKWANFDKDPMSQILIILANAALTGAVLHHVADCALELMKWTLKNGGL